MWLITVCVWVVVDQGKVLIIKRANPEGNLVYQFPAGKMETWEDAMQGAQREVLEETWYVVKAKTFLGERLHPYTKVHLSYRWCSMVGQTERHNRIKDMVEEIVWVPIDQLDNYFTTDLFAPVKIWLEKQL